MSKSAEAFRTIGEVADELDVPKHVLRFWEGKFPQIRPMKRGGGRRYYRPEDMVLLRGIRHLLHAEGYTIKGVQKILREQGIDQVKAASAASAAGAAKTVADRGHAARSRHHASEHTSKQTQRRGTAPKSGSTAAITPKPHRKSRSKTPSATGWATPRQHRRRRKTLSAAAIRELEICRRFCRPGASTAAGTAAPRLTICRFMSRVP